MCSNMNAIFVVSATIYSLGFIISSHYCLGSPNLIEYVEEWGCYDSEIRLTCGHLDSKIAILEATFTPNCTQEECIKGDLKRLMRGRHRSTFANFRSAETEAGRKFLETLRETDLNPNAELVNGDSPNVESIPKANYLVGVKEKRASLRASLERLIVKYLRQISPGDNYQEFGEHLRRYRRNLLSLSEAESDDTVTESRSERVMIGTRNVSFDDVEMQDRAGGSEERYRKYYENRGFCEEQKRKISTLSRLQMDESLKKQNDTRQNIRKNLNKRCSGKNHCSFLFAADDPLAVLWDSGLVNIKYVCMDDYHTNHYCNEHLTIGYDNSPKRRQVQNSGKGEPVAEARVQTRDQVLHSVKILKTSDEVENAPSIVEEELPKRRKSEKMQKARKKEKGIYSQDFRVLKILPSNLDDFNDIEEIGDEIYFRTDDDKKKDLLFPNDLEPTALTLGSDSPPPPSVKTSILPIITLTTSGYSNNFENSENHKGDLSKFENITIIIREGEQYFVTYPTPRILNSSPANESSAETTHSLPPAVPTTTATTTILSSSSISTPPSSILPPFPSTMPPASIMATTTRVSASNRPSSTIDEMAAVTAGASFVTFAESVTDDSSRYSATARPKQQEEIETTNIQDIETAAPTVSVLSVDASNSQYTTVNNGWGDTSYDDMGSKPDRSNIEEDDDTDDSLEGGYYGATVRRQYTSIQRTYYGAPKLQGFTMTPGYPKFYIGDCECKWKILAPVAQKIRLTILDVSLRYEKKCRDYLQITDSISQKILFKSCEEPVSPVEILSSSNQVEIVVKAATKFAYPKRGVLIHYSALGCLTPPPPMHGLFIERTESTVAFACEPSFVFPDSSTGTRQLLCTNQHTWNDTLPDCVGSSNSSVTSSLLQKLIASLYK